jgi:membrane fusion protein (multidrug efflux system)
MNPNSASKSIPFTFTTGLLVSLLLLGLVGCAAPEEQEESGGETATPVSVAEVESRSLSETLQGIGTLRADQTVQISPEIAGRVEAVEFQEGDTVEKGDTLVRIDDDKLQQQYKSAQFSLDEAQAQLRNARQTFERNKRLRKKDVISAQAFDDSREAYQSAQARVGRLEAQVQEARENLEDATLRAPFDGAVGSREVDAGNYVQPGSVLTTLYKLDPLEVRFTVPGRFVGWVRRGQRIRLHVSSRPDTTFTGEVYFVSPSVREQTRDLLLKASVQNPGHELQPGAFARVELILETLENRPVVPAEALIATRDGYIVFTVKNGKAHRTPVEIGLRKPGFVEIRQGLSVGDRVISSGHLSVSDGSTVKIADDNE